MLRATTMSDERIGLAVPARRGPSGVVALSLLALAAVFVPLWLAALDPVWLATSYGQRTVAFELFGFTTAVALASVAAHQWRRRPIDSVRPLLSTAVPLLVALHFATILSEYPLKPFDYDCYEYAARALIEGENPYFVGLNYLYPPLTAQVFAAAFEASQFVATGLGYAPAADTVWDAVFYLYQCSQVGLIVGLYFLGLRFAELVGVDRAWAPLLVGALLVFDDAVLRNLRHGQINLWVLDASLVALLGAHRRPALAGAALAIAVHIKLYPIVLVAPLVLGRCWRAALWTGVAFAAIVVVQTDLLRDWTPWLQFADFYGGIYPGEIAYRNNSFHSLAFNSVRLVFGDAPALHRDAIRGAATLVSAAMAGWLLLRMVGRVWRDRRATVEPLLDNGADALAFSLLISQSVWEHHYVLAIPLALLAVARFGRERPVFVIACLYLALGMPTFDLFPLSYHRAAGLLGLLWLTAPRRIRKQGAS
jgi:hypothetical protein